jgi:hypothetical protein
VPRPRPARAESITKTARIYAHLYDDELDSVTAALDRIGRED